MPPDLCGGRYPRVLDFTVNERADRCEAAGRVSAIVLVGD